MKGLRCFYIALILLCILTRAEYAAVTNTDFSTKIISDEEAESFLAKVQITKIATEPERKSIECFDVNSEQYIAIGCGATDRKTIGVYTNDGMFVYGYRFNCSGKFGVKWDNDDLIIYFVRSDIALALDRSGEVKSICEIENSTENNSYWNDFIYATERTVDGIKYIVMNDMGIFNFFASSYTQLAVINSDGTQEIIYDTNDDNLTRFVVISVIVLLFAGISLFAIFRKMRK